MKRIAERRLVGRIVGISRTKAVQRIGILDVHDMGGRQVMRIVLMAAMLDVQVRVDDEGRYIAENNKRNERDSPSSPRFRLFVHRF